MGTIPRDTHAQGTAPVTAHDPTKGVVTFQEEVVRSALARKFLAGLRIVLGFTFLWPFLDKMFGLGYMTPSAKAWIHGGTPAQGFMKGAEGPFASFFKNIAGPWADWLFMAGLLGIGIALLAGAGLKLAAWTGCSPSRADVPRRVPPRHHRRLHEPARRQPLDRGTGHRGSRHDARRGHLGPWQVVGPPRR